MLRIIVLDTSGLYSQIYDELYCSKTDWEEIRGKYQKQGFLCIKICLDSNYIDTIHII